MDDKDWGIYGKGFEGYAHYNAAYNSTKHIAGQSKGNSNNIPSQEPWTKEQWEQKIDECICIWLKVLVLGIIIVALGQLR